jgi:hypothetical protein
MLVVSDHHGAGEVEVGLVRPVGVDEYDPLIGVALADLAPRESLVMGGGGSRLAYAIPAIIRPAGALSRFQSGARRISITAGDRLAVAELEPQNRRRSGEDGGGGR